MVRHGVFWGLLFSLAAGLSSCQPGPPPQEPPLNVHLAPATTVPEGMGLVIWVDAFELSAFHKLQRAGQLPNITRYLLDRGVFVEEAIASLPTITYANNISFVTGRYPGHHGITDNKWFDRYSLVCRDYTLMRTYRRVDEDYPGPTIFELLGDEFTATILTPVRRGATRNIDNWTQAGATWALGMAKTVNWLTSVRFELVSSVANEYGRWPKFIFAYYASPDRVAHERGLGQDTLHILPPLWGPRPYEDILRDVDDQVGLVCRAMEGAGLLDKTVITLVSDHGMVETPKHLDLLRYFRDELGIVTTHGDFGHDTALEERVRHFGPARAEMCIGGDRHAAIHLRPGYHWYDRPTEEQINTFVACFGRTDSKESLPRRLARLPATDLVLVRLGDDSVRLLSAGGEATIERARRDGVKLYRYVVTSGQDPLGYDACPAARALMDGQWHDGDAWFRAGLQTDRPDCVVQLIEMNDSPHSGDVVLFARDGWDFGTRNLAGHGGLTRQEVVVPWIWAGPGLPRNATVRGGRTVDLMPTMLQLIGREKDVPPGIDGRSMADRLIRAGASAPTTQPLDPANK